MLNSMHTVLGLRSLGERAALVAHPDGELIRRMAEGLDLIPLAPTHEVDLAAAWRRASGVAMQGQDPLEQLARLAGLRSARYPY